MKKNKFFSLVKEKQTATLNIYGDITSWPWEELGEVSAVSLSKQLEALGDVEQIDVYINSYGGEVAEGLAIYNALRRHKAKVRTYCDGFACSIASVIFMAGDERIMNESSLLMIHNAWTYAMGNSAELRKQADDLEKITQASVEAYKSHSPLSEKEIKKLMDNETWILPEDALSYGFATTVEKTENENASQSAWLQLFDIIKAHQEKTNNEDEEPENDLDDEEEEDKDNDTEGEDTPENEPETPSDEDSDDEDDEGEEEQSEEEEDTETDEDEAAQLWGGFFNALIK
jgi:ATP-dependent Clp protease protease subunit